jgi:hypothetical protein
LNVTLAPDALEFVLQLMVLGRAPFNRAAHLRRLACPSSAPIWRTGLPESIQCSTA